MLPLYLGQLTLLQCARASLSVSPSPLSLCVSVSNLHCISPSVFSYSFQVLLPQVPTAHHTSLSLRRVSQFCFFPPTFVFLDRQSAP